MLQTIKISFQKSHNPCQIIWLSKDIYLVGDGKCLFYDFAILQKILSVRKQILDIELLINIIFLKKIKN